MKMSDEEHSDSEFYYPEEQYSAECNASRYNWNFDEDEVEENVEAVDENTDKSSSQEEIEALIQEQKSKNIVKKQQATSILFTDTSPQ